MSYKNRIIFAVLKTSFCMLACMAHAQVMWHRTPMSDESRKYDHLVAISTPANATYNGKTLRAYVFIYEHDELGKEGVPKLGVYIENIEEIIPETELSMFVGPDLPRSVMRDGTLELSIDVHGAKEQLTTYTHYARQNFFDTGWNSPGYFALSYSKANRAKWKTLVTKMSEGFTDADITIGGSVLSHQLRIHFTGAGLGSQLKDLMQYCER